MTVNKHVLPCVSLSTFDVTLCFHLQAPQRQSITGLEICSKMLKAFVNIVLALLKRLFRLAVRIDCLYFKR